MAKTPGSGKSNIVLPSKAKSATVKDTGATPGSKYGYGAGKKSGK